MFLPYPFEKSFINSFKGFLGFKGSPDRNAKYYHCNCGRVQLHPVLSYLLLLNTAVPFSKKNQFFIIHWYTWLCMSD